MNLKPYKIGTVVTVENFNYDEFTIEGYHIYLKIHKGVYEESIMYTVRKKDGKLWQIVHDLVRPKEDSCGVYIKSAQTTDELLDMLKDYKVLYDMFGDDEYMSRLEEVENTLKHKISNRR